MSGLCLQLCCPHVKSTAEERPRLDQHDAPVDFCFCVHACTDIAISFAAAVIFLLHDQQLENIFFPADSHHPHLHAQFNDQLHLQGMRPMRMQPDFGDYGDFGGPMGMRGPMMFPMGEGGGYPMGGFGGRSGPPRPSGGPPPEEPEPMFPRQVSAGGSGARGPMLGALGDLSGRRRGGFEDDEDVGDDKVLYMKAMMGDMGAMQKLVAAQQRSEGSRRRGDRHRRCVCACACACACWYRLMCCISVWRCAVVWLHAERR